MPGQLTEALNYSHKNKENFLGRYKEFLSIPSISTGKENLDGINRAAQWLEVQLKALGMEDTRVIPTSHHPIVWGERLKVPGAPTILIYGHYDVQPIDPLDQWKFGPFIPTVIGDEIYARGASDMKGQTLVTLMAAESLIQSGGLPINIKWLFEGEEEIGSPSLEDFLTNNKDMLVCNFAINPDSGMIGKEYPTITNALRGIAYFELRIYGPKHDLHSGIYGGVVHNPAIVLADLISGMHDEKGRITLPNFYDNVRELTKMEREEMERLPIGEKHFLDQTGVQFLYGEEGYTSNERSGARPTLDVNGLLAGFIEEGSKTVIPSRAMAKISMRLVPDQKPAEVKNQLIQYINKNMPKDVSWELTEFQSGMPSISNPDNDGVKAMSRALETVWGRRPFFHREGGSIPVVALMQRILGVESIIAGFSLPDDNIHAPNEKQNLPNWFRGIDAYIHFFLNLQ